MVRRSTRHTLRSRTLIFAALASVTRTLRISSTPPLRKIKIPALANNAFCCVFGTIFEDLRFVERREERKLIFNYTFWLDESSVFNNVEDLCMMELIIPLTIYDIDKILQYSMVYMIIARGEIINVHFHTQVDRSRNLVPNLIRGW